MWLQKKSSRAEERFICRFFRLPSLRYFVPKCAHVVLAGLGSRQQLLPATQVATLICRLCDSRAALTLGREGLISGRGTL